MPYLLSEEKLKEIYGSKNKELIKTLIDNNSESLEELEDLFDEDPAVYIKDFVNGKIKHETGGLYVYVLEMIFSNYGEMLNNDEWYPTDYWETLDDLTYNQSNFNFPDIDDFPLFKILKPDSMENVIKKISKSKKIPESAREQVIDWLKQGIDTNSLLGLFYY